MVETSQARKGLQSLTVIPDQFRPPFRRVLVQSIVGAIRVIQVSNRTPILGNYEAFVIHGIPGATAR